MRSVFGRGMGMKELLRTNDVALLSFVDALLSESGIPHVLADVHMSVLEGSLGVLPRRVLIDDDDWKEAVELLTDAGLEADIAHEPK
jgi:hypothetical protein